MFIMQLIVQKSKIRFIIDTSILEMRLYFKSDIELCEVFHNKVSKNECLFS